MAEEDLGQIAVEALQLLSSPIDGEAAQLATAELKWSTDGFERLRQALEDALNSYQATEALDTIVRLAAALRSRPHGEKLANDLNELVRSFPQAVHILGRAAASAHHVEQPDQTLAQQEDRKIPRRAPRLNEDTPPGMVRLGSISDPHAQDRNRVLSSSRKEKNHGYT